jgi:hypothetical protein
MNSSDSPPPVELWDRFEEFEQELQYAACLALMSASEALLRTDYAVRVYERKKDSLSRSMRDLYNKNGLKVSLSNDLLELWGTQFPECKAVIGNYRGAIKFRDWRAHGRWWVPKIGKKYLLQDIFDIADQLFQKLPEIEEDWVT